MRSLVKNAMYDRIPGVLRRGPTHVKRVALTFDDGPDHMTEQYLDVLDRLGVPATFFLIGENIANRPALVREYIRRGHQIAGHSYDHTRFPELGNEALLEQCARTEQALGAQLTERAWIRPPHGTLDARTLVTLLAGGYTIAMWSFDSQDYDIKEAEQLVAGAKAIRAGDVILMHEGQDWTLAALPGIVETLREQGLELVTMHDLFAR
ncbi:MAG: polysaccharide deacetylase family protein [Kofleriaceae bacterium]